MKLVEACTNIALGVVGTFLATFIVYCANSEKVRTKINSAVDLINIALIFISPALAMYLADNLTIPTNQFIAYIFGISIFDLWLLMIFMLRQKTKSKQAEIEHLESMLKFSRIDKDPN